MTLEEMQEALTKAQESIKKLEAKNSELIDREKDAKRKADEAEDAREEADRIANEKSGDVEKIKADLKKVHDREIKKIQDANTAMESRLSTLLIDNTINEAIAKNGVLPHFTPAITAMLKLGAKMENGEAMVDGQPLSDKISSFFTSENARHYVAAPDNSGGGAQGSSAKANSHGFTKENFSSRMSEWAELQVTNPTEANAIAIAVGKPNLVV